MNEVELRAAAEAAMDEIVRLCQPGEHWRMSIPADERRDSDLLLTAALKEIGPLLDRLASAEVAVERIEALIEDRERWAAEKTAEIRERWANNPSPSPIHRHQYAIGAVYGTDDLRTALEAVRNAHESDERRASGPGDVGTGDATTGGGLR